MGICTTRSYLFPYSLHNQHSDGSDLYLLQGRHAVLLPLRVMCPIISQGRSQTAYLPWDTLTRFESPSYLYLWCTFGIRLVLDILTAACRVEGVGPPALSGSNPRQSCNLVSELCAVLCFFHLTHDIFGRQTASPPRSFRLYYETQAMKQASSD